MFNGKESFDAWLNRKGFLQRRAEAELTTSRRLNSKIDPKDLYVPRLPGEPFFHYTSVPPSFAAVAFGDPNFTGIMNRNNPIRYRSQNPHRPDDVYETTETGALLELKNRLAAFMNFCRGDYWGYSMSYDLESLTELVSSMYLIGAPERRAAISALAERLLTATYLKDVKIYLPSKRSDLFTATQVLHTIGSMNQLMGNSLDSHIQRISISDSQTDVVQWFSEDPENRQVTIFDDQVMSGMQSAAMHYRLFKAAEDIGLAPETLREATELNLIAGRPPTTDKPDLYTARKLPFQVYSYYRTLPINGLKLQDTVPIISTHCPGDFGFSEVHRALFKRVDQWFNLPATAPILDQQVTIKPYDTDANGKFLYPEFQAQWDQVQSWYGDRMSVTVKSNSQI